MSRANLIGGVAALVVATLLAQEALRLPTRPGVTVGPGTMPLLISVALATSAVVLIVSSFISRWLGKVQPEQAFESSPDYEDVKRVTIFLSLVVLFALALIYLPFLLTATVFIAAAVSYLEAQEGYSWLGLTLVKNLALGIGLALGTYFLFGQVLGVPLP